MRLQDMGVEPYLVASSLLMVQAQRLVRTLCPNCKEARDVREADWKALSVNADVFAGVKQVYESKGCDQCMQTGYLGRIGIFEMLRISDDMRTAIHDGKGLLVLKRLAKKEGMNTLAEDGARHVAAGITSVDEVLRVTRQDTVVVEV